MLKIENKSIDYRGSDHIPPFQGSCGVLIDYMVQTVEIQSEGDRRINPTLTIIQLKEYADGSIEITPLCGKVGLNLKHRCEVTIIEEVNNFDMQTDAINYTRESEKP